MSDSDKPSGLNRRVVMGLGHTHGMRCSQGTGQTQWGKGVDAGGKMGEAAKAVVRARVWSGRTRQWKG